MDQLVEVTLAKRWGGHKKGAIVRCDPGRAAQLRGDGFLADPDQGGSDGDQKQGADRASGRQSRGTRAGSGKGRKRGTKGVSDA